MVKWPISSLPSMDKITQGEFYFHFLKHPLITSKYLNNIVREKLLTDIMTKISNEFDYHFLPDLVRSVFDESTIETAGSNGFD